MQQSTFGQRAAFSLYLRTGRRLTAAEIEVKFNPWHDEENGRFTFAGQGRYFGAGGAGKPETANMARQVKTPPPPGNGSAENMSVPGRNSARHPDNYAIYTVRPGDSLSRIAAQREGLSAADLAWLNKQPIDQPLKVGQQIKVPHQAYLDAGRSAKNKFVALSHYMDTHGGKLPPNVAHPPSLESQILDRPGRKESKNGYDFHIDPVARTHKVHGELSDGPIAPRSRSNQAQAGKPDRRQGKDDGGHFIAARFNGPSDSFNHFAQDRNFNRGAYRKLEDDWAKALRAGHKVAIDIDALYQGASRRPYQLNVTWTINGHKSTKRFANEAKGAHNDER
ncbi:LysM peptidoglycan-binding domain-containing protein [Sphingobium amiense]|uniref:LysM peptidoglycan-binding domain-containing protein n=1 Tax=Sphingobium amiense TaxID=135719 RepID=A0A494WFA5_9SPHN|nr:DNA/RNA non-specific endonuclease [Sphingobium amiense]BBD99259.1 LysM peptidoglycan-binding domain-containing protein [Sphingobium amiense]